MNKEELKDRTKKFAVRVFKFLKTLSQGKDVEVISYQLFKSSSSVAANYRSACRSKSYADFSNKLKVVNEKVDESLFWIEFIEEIELKYDKNELNEIKKEANELVSIFTAAIKTIIEKQNGTEKSLIIH
jgi:four helix bundle protein